MKIAVFINKFEDCDFTSGGEKVNFLILKAFHELGYDFDVFCNEKVSKNENGVFNVFERQLDLLNKRRAENYYKFVFSENYRHFDVNYVHENSRLYRQNVVLSFWEKLIKRIFLSERYKTHEEIAKIDKEALSIMSRVIVPSSLVKDDVVEQMNCSPEKIYIISPPVVLPKVSVSENNNRLFTFGLVARSFELKGGYDFLFALLLLKQKKTDFSAKIIAAQNKQSKKMDIIKFFTKLLGFDEKIEFCDYGSKIEEFYSSVDCVVMPSRRDAFGLVAAEAMSYGLPVIVSSRCGVKDYIKDNENGFVYQYGKNNILKLYQKMLYVLENKDSLDELKDSAKLTSEQFSFEKFKNKIKEAIESIL